MIGRIDIEPIRKVQFPKKIPIELDFILWLVEFIRETKNKVVFSLGRFTEREELFVMFYWVLSGLFVGLGLGFWVAGCGLFLGDLGCNERVGVEGGEIEILGIG
jgi:hypothetical protein